MRIIHTADWHLGKNIEGESRMDEQEAFLDFFVESCDELRPDLILIAGDIYDVANPPSRAEQLLYRALKRLSREGECISLLIAGNHDSPERLVSAAPLAMEHGIIMMGTPKTVIAPGTYGRHEVLSSSEGFLELKINDEKLAIISVPYPSEKRLNEVFYGDEEGEEERLESYQEKMKYLFQGLEKNFKEDTINLTVTHLFAFGAEPTGTERTNSLGGSFLIGTDSLPQGAHYTALGHIHRPQILPNTNQRMRYSGSPLHYSLAETSFVKKFYVVDIDRERKVEITEVEIPIFKPIQLWHMDSIEAAIEKCEENQGMESWVYLEIKTDRPIREDEIKKMKSFKKDILEIRPLIDFAALKTERTNISELPLKEQFIEFYKAKKKMQPEEEMVELLMSIWEEDDEDEAN